MSFYESLEYLEEKKGARIKHDRENNCGVVNIPMNKEQLQIRRKHQKLGDKSSKNNIFLYILTIIEVIKMIKNNKAKIPYLDNTQI